MSRRSQYAPGYGKTTSLSDVGHGLLDPALTIGGGLLGSAVGGLMALPVWAMKGPDEAQMMLEAAQERARYNPTNPSGQQSTQAIFDTLGTISEPLNAMSQGIGDFAYEHAPEGWEAEFGTAGLLAPDLGATLIGLPYALKAGRKLDQSLKHLRVDPTPKKPTPFSKQQGIIAGPKAKTANQELLTQAKEMKKQGVNPDLIYAETKWWLDHPDGVPRFEIDDSSALMPRMRKPHRGTLEGYYDHDELYTNYPKAQNITFSSQPDSSGGAYMPGLNHMKIKGTDDLAKYNTSTATHESQHFVQQKEGFSRGGSPDDFDQAGLAEIARDAKMLATEIRARKKKSPDADYIALENQATSDFRELGMTILPEARDMASRPYMRFPDKHPEDYKNMMDLVKFYGLDKKTTSHTPREMYLKLAGEAEARMVQDRLNMSMDERMIDPFYDNYKVPFEDMIIRQGGGGLLAQSITPDWQKTSKEYNTLPNKKSMESIYIPVGNKKVEVIQNPTSSDVSSMSKEAVKQYGRSDVGDSPLRFTEDAGGNRYVWKSYEGMHYNIEPELGKRVNATLNQNASQKPSHRNVIRRALYDGESIPQNVLIEYPDLMDEVRQISGNKISGLLQ